jgi:hypothetical protein
MSGTSDASTAVHCPMVIRVSSSAQSGDQEIAKNHPDREHIACARSTRVQRLAVSMLPTLGMASPTVVVSNRHPWISPGA